LSNEKEKPQESKEKAKSAEKKPEAAKGPIAELLYLGSNPNPGSKDVVWASSGWSGKL